MQFKVNYHTHSTYCDGKSSLKEMVRSAEEKGFQQLGFSSHAPVPFENNFGIRPEAIPEYCQEIDQLQAQTPVNLLKALECDFIPGMCTPFDNFRHEHHLDYIIGGVHLVRPQHSDQLWFIDGHNRQIYDDGLAQLFDHNIKAAVTTFWEQTFEMLETQHLDIIAHFDKIKMHNQNRFFTEDESWYRTLATHAVELIHQCNVIVEINTRGLYKKRCNSFYPSTELLRLIRKYDIPVVVSSDAHKLDELDMFFDEAYAELKQCGIGHLVHFDVKTRHFRTI